MTSKLSRWAFATFFPLIAQRERAHSLKRKQVVDALTDYPPFNPPHRDRQHDLAPEDSKENFEFLISRRADRVTALANFLKKFETVADVDDAGVDAVSVWVAQYAGYLADDFDDPVTKEAYFDFAEPWIGNNIGLNVIFDLGIYLAEAMIARKQKIRWGPGVFVLFGVTGGKPFDPFLHSYHYCRGVAIAHKSGVGTRHATKYDSFARFLRGSV